MFLHGYSGVGLYMEGHGYAKDQRRFGVLSGLLIFSLGVLFGFWLVLALLLVLAPLVGLPCLDERFSCNPTNTFWLLPRKRQEGRQKTFDETMACEGKMCR